MVGAFETDPLPLDPRLEHDSFSTDDVPLDLGLLRGQAGLVADEVPLAGQAPVAGHWGGLCTMTPDGRFIAGPIPDVPGLWVASGCNVSGFSFSPAIGEALAGWITGGHPSADVEALAPARFGPVADDRLVRDGAWQYAHFYDPAEN